MLRHWYCGTLQKGDSNVWMELMRELLLELLLPSTRILLGSGVEEIVVFEGRRGRSDEIGGSLLWLGREMYSETLFRKNKS